MISRHSLVVIAVAAVLGASIGLPSAAREVVLLTFLAVGIWVAALPKGWYSGTTGRARAIMNTFLIVRLGMPMVTQAIGENAQALFSSGWDSNSYHNRGVLVASDLALFGQSYSHRGAPGTGSIDLAVGYLYSLGAPVRLGVVYFSAALATIGLILFWSATEREIGRNRLWYMGFVLLSPTLLLWNSNISKEAPIMFGLGCVAAGLQRFVERGVSLRAFAYMGAGFAVIGAVRPHIALLLAAGCLVGLPLSSTVRGGQRPSRLDRIGPLTAGRRLALIIAAATALVALIPVTRSLLAVDDGSSLLDAAYARADIAASGRGGSAFAASPTRSIVDLPNAISTVLFQPYPWEVRSVPQLAASAEATVVGVLLVVGLVRVVRRRSRLIRSPMAMTAVVYSILFCAVVVSYGNFGLIVRQRMQVLGFVILIIFSIVPVARTRTPSRVESRAGAARRSLPRLQTSGNALLSARSRSTRSM